LLVETMRRMQQDGVHSAQLTVNLNNPGAIQAYTRLDFKIIGRRARYERAG
jgi:ribosomal protein S18 acetylase RimI-like enzyme